MSFKIAVLFPGKVGDALFATSSIRYIAEKNPGAEIHWLYGAPGLTDFVTKCLVNTDLPVTQYIPYEIPYLHVGIHGKDWRTMDWSSVMPGYDAYYNLSIGTFPEPGCHLIEWIARGGGLIKRGDLLPVSYLKFKHPPIGRERNEILVNPWIPPVERQWKELMKLKPEYRGYRVCSIGHPDDPMVPGTRDLRGIDYLDYIDHLRTARLVIGLCSSSVVLAAAFAVPAIMIHNISNPLNAGISRFGPLKFDLCKPPIYTIEETLNESLLSMRLLHP